ncbi:MAG: peptidase M15 [Spiribacter salinus]|uniref:Peptidase M15 n=1 Tax=Spiribacter salinus TaxID=1335746 RepID=A0A540VJE9_9GAMM|nr:MAG: peptidase M15 [Spiribacter salinus]
MIDWQRVQYFQRREFGDGEPGVEPDPMLVEKLDEARKYAGVPFVIESGLRTIEHNREVGGVDDSAHVTGKAVDILCTNSRYRWHILDALFAVGFLRVGIGRNFIHVDIDKDKPKEVAWLYD